MSKIIHNMSIRYSNDETQRKSSWNKAQRQKPHQKKDNEIHDYA